MLNSTIERYNKSPYFIKLILNGFGPVGILYEML